MCADFILELSSREWTDASSRSSLENIPMRNIASTKAIGTTYNVPRIKRGKIRAKIAHIVNACRVRHTIQKIQNSQELRFVRANIRRPNNAQKVHMTAACHLCGAPRLSRTIAATSTNPSPIHPRRSSLPATPFFSNLRTFYTSRRQWRQHGSRKLPCSTLSGVECLPLTPDAVGGALLILPDTPQ